MDQPFDSDLMEDLAADSSSASAEDMFDEWGNEDAGDNAFYDTMDGFESEGADSSYGEGDFEDDFIDEAVTDFDSDYGNGGYGKGNALDTLEDAIADALGAEDADEFQRYFRRVVNIARQAGQSAGERVARTAPAMSRRQAQSVGRIASAAGRLLSKGADEFEALDAVLDLAEEEDEIDAALPVIAGLTIRTVMPRIAQVPRPVRQQLVRSVGQSARLLVRRQGPQAVRAMTPLMQAVQRNAQQRRLPSRQLPQVIQQAARRVAADPRLTRQLAQRQPSLTSTRHRSRPGLGIPRRLVFEGPVEISIRTR